MWNNMTLRKRITLVSALCLTVICIGMTAFFNYSAARVFEEPFLSLPVEEAEAGNDVLEPIDAVASQQAFTAASRELYWKTILYMAGFVLIGGTLIWLIAGKVLEPMEKLNQAVGKIDESRLDQSLTEPKGKDEVASLTKSFNQMLKRVNNAYTVQKTFAQNAAHELKTPVASIIASLDVLALDEEPTTEDYKEAIADITQSTNRMEALIKDLMMTNTALDETTFTRFSASKMMDELFSAFRSVAEKRNISLLLEGDTQLYGNRPLLTRAFSNLISNAIRYNKDGGQVVVHCTEQKISISDTGIGIPEDKISRIFEPFYCVDPSRSRMLGGSGLGLSIVKQILDEHCMKVDVKSENGTTFSIQL